MIETGNDLWGFRRNSLPKDFDGFERKVTSAGAASRYSGSPEKGSTLIPALIKALWIYNGRASQELRWALGKLSDGRYIAELQSSARPELTTIVAYDPQDGGAIRAISYDEAADEKKKYNINPDYAKGNDAFHHSDGTAVFLCMLPEILSDDEAAGLAAELGEPGTLSDEEMNRKLAAFCDNVYRRAIYSAGEHQELKVANIGTKGPVKGFNMSEIRNDRIKVREVIHGEFRHIGTAEKLDFAAVKEGEYRIETKLTDEQKAMIRSIPKGHVTSATEVKILDIIRRTRDDVRGRVNNILLEGPPGTGKTQIAIAISHHLGLPYYPFICSDGTNEDSLLGCYYPEIPEGSGNDEFLASYREFRKSMPSNLEIQFEPEKAYEKLTGKKQEGISPEEVYSLANMLMDDNLKEAEKLLKSGAEGGIRYRYCPSPLVEAFRNGGVVELQEPSAIVSASVLSCLNDIMNSSDGVINTPVGPIRRHENCYVIATTNPDSNGGYRKLNEAVRNRFQRTYSIPLPSQNVMVERVLSHGYLKDIAVAEKMAFAVSVIEDTIAAKAIQGTAGMRCLFEWAKDVAAGDSIVDSMMSCVVNNVTTNRDEQELILDAVKNNTEIYTL